MTAMIFPQTSMPSSSSYFLSLAIASSIAPPLFKVPPSFSSLSMSVAKQKSFEKFLWLSLSRLDGAPSNSAYDFLSESADRLCNLAMLKSYGVAYISYKFTTSPWSGGGQL